MRKFKTILLLALCAVALASFAACAGGYGALDEAILDEFPIRVTLDYNGGVALNNTQRRLQVKENGKISYSVLVSKNLIPALEGFHVIGFATGEKAEDGTITLDTLPDGTVDFWNFDADVVTGDMTLFAVWNKNYTIGIYMPNGNLNRSYIVSENANSVTQANLDNILNRVDGYTFYGGYFMDVEMTHPVTFPIVHPMVQGEEELKVYVSWVEGDFRIVSDLDSLRLGLQNGNGIYLTQDIDCNGQTLPITSNYAAEISGNNHKIYNFKTSISQSGVTAGYFGLFRTIKATANIHDVTFEDFTVTAESRGNAAQIMIGVFAGMIETGARFANVTVNGTVNYTLQSSYLPGGRYEDRVSIGTICGNETSLSSLSGVTVTGSATAVTE